MMGETFQILKRFDELSDLLNAEGWLCASDELDEDKALVRKLLRVLAKIEHEWDGEPEDMEEAREVLREARGSS